MADERDTRAAADPVRPAREAPTIDLTATEIPSDTPKQAAPPPEPPEPPAGDGAPPPPEPDEPHDARSRGLALPLAAGFAGGLIPAAILAGLWYGGVLPGRGQPDLAPRLVQIEQQIASVRDDVSALQSRTKELAGRPAASGPAAPAVDPKAVDALAQRVAKLESAVSNLPAQGNTAPDPQLGKRIDAVESAVKSNESSLTALGKQVDQAAAAANQAQHQFEVTGTAVSQLAARVDNLAKQQPAEVSPAQLADVQKQVAALEQTTQGLSKQASSNAAATSAARLALAAATLRNAVLSNAPYQAELAQARALGADDKQLAPLQKFAASGAPSDAALAAQLRALLPALSKAAAPQEAEGTFLDRLRANAGRLVRITPANAPAGDAPSDVLTRLAVDAEHADIAAALREISKLPQDAQDKVSAWVATAKAREATFAAARALATDTARTLGPG